MTFSVFRKFGAVALVLAWFIVPATSEAACGTSTASLHGWYAMLVTGGNLTTTATTTAGTAKYQVGAVLFDGVGDLSATNVYGPAGQHSAATGTYVQNVDCTLTIFLTVGAASPATYTVGIKNTGEAVGIEVDAAAVANISFKPQYAVYTPGLDFTSSSLNGTFAASCIGTISPSSDLNRTTFANGTMSGTDPYNNSGAFAKANVPFAGTYTVNSDGTFAGTLTVLGTPFAYYGVLATSSTEIAYIYEDVSGALPIDAFASCTGGTAL
jgi:hypothetical protein